MPGVRNLVKKTNYNTKGNEIEKKSTDILLLQNLVSLGSKSDITNFPKNTDFDDKLKNLNKKVKSSKTKHFVVENDLKKRQTFDSSPFIGQSYFNNAGSKN